MQNELIHDFCRGNRKSVAADVPLWCRLARNAEKMTQVGPPIVHICVWLWAHIPSWFKIFVRNRWCECHSWHVCLLCLCRIIFKVCKWDVWECVHIFCLLALPMYGHELALAIFSSPAYLIACLQVLVKKIAPPLQECLLLFFSLCKISTLRQANCKDNVPRRTSTTGMLYAFNCVSRDFICFWD